MLFESQFLSTLFIEILQALFFRETQISKKAVI